MFLKNIILVSLCVGLSHGVVYDYFTGQPASEEQLNNYEELGVTDTCTIEIEPCAENERSRVDGSCNNLNSPARGTYFSPLVRVLPPIYYNGYFARKAVSGNELPLARKVRVDLLKQGNSNHPLFNQNVPGFFVFVSNDVGSFHDVKNMIGATNYCCVKEHMNDYACTPNIIPDDDPVHMFSNIRCMNSTRPLTYQDYNCTNEPVPAPIKQATTQFDNSQIYNTNNKGDKAIRSFQKGQLAVEEEDGKLFPPNGPNVTCINNVGNETRCFENYINALMSISLFTIWFVRHHNYIASQLAEVNPCWDDDMLFGAARDINIAFTQQIHLYEWMVALQGRENLIKAGVITADGGFRDLYDKNNYPQVTLEYDFAIRWFHLTQPSRAKLYDKNGTHITDYPIVNATFRPGLLAKDNNMEYFAQSTFRAPCSHADGSIEADLANNGAPGVQLSIDIPAGDVNKGRNLGIRPYIDYVKHFLGLNITSFEDLAELIPNDKLLIMQDLYEDVRDIDLIAGLWVEKKMEGGHMPLLLAKIINENVLRSIRSDRHWYERPNRPFAFNLAQLLEIRKANLASLLCNVGDGIIQIPKQAFLNISPLNPLVSCNEIPNIDYSAWSDPSCNSNTI
ncbi:peroxidase-like isoform X2 [Helicoverpa armigera]|uniref:peroxidase-like isoform X2 n=1 Tax=Helicoverpa armigera TaxID=29058 RepID=UPI003082C1FF